VNSAVPLAERLRPQTLNELIGQEHLAGKGSILRTAIEGGKIPSILLWGPPGTGKTTIANIIAHTLNKTFFTLSAISSGVKEVREAIQLAQKTTGAILFIDEIHRFNKGQQDALLGAVEKGIITLIGATTENPSFEVNSALLSRCQVYVLKPLSGEDLVKLLHHALETDNWLKTKKIQLQETEALINISGGDARKLLNLLELVVDALSPGESGAKVVITDEKVMEIAQQRIALYDKSGEQHYDIISAFIKSMRGSDPNGAIYWLARMIEGGEDVKFIARRMVIFASEDIGNANPNALLLANGTFDAVTKIGYPEARIILAQCATYLASSYKSNASYMAIEEALDKVRKGGYLPVPLHIRNAPTGLMKGLGYGKNYKYAHDFEGNFTEQEFLPDELKGTAFYDPGQTPREEELRKFLKSRWGAKYNY
jgi:putative ATPase